MLKVEILRGKSTNDGTPGKLTCENGFSCDALELPWHNNKTGLSCIVADTYVAKRWHSPHFNRWVYRLEDKHGRKDCLLHPANFAGEVGIGEESQLHGCTAVGKGYGNIARDDNGTLQLGILHSSATLDALFDSTHGDDLEITYRWADGCEPDDLTDAQENAS
jgi:hypothetical protein